MFHHLVPTEATLHELVRVLRSGGSLTIIDGVALSPGMAAQLDDELTTARLAVEPIYGFDLHELADLVMRVGFEIEKINYDGMLTFATPLYVSKPYTTDRFVLAARRL